MRAVVTMCALLLVSAVYGQDDTASEPELEQLKGAFECTVLQTAEGDVLQLNCTETESPLAGDWHFEIYRVTRSRFSSSRVTIWLRSKVEMHELRLLVKFHHNDNGVPLVNTKSTWSYEVEPGETFSETAYPDFTPIQSVEIANDPLYGPWVCKGCGVFEFDDIEVSMMVDPVSIQTEDAGRFLQEMQEAILH